MNWISVAKGVILLFSLTGAVLVLFGLPGVVVAFLGCLPAASLTLDFPTAVIVTIGLGVGSLIVEALDNVLLVAVALRMGASRSAGLAGWVGSFVGAIVGGSAVGAFGCLVSLIVAFLGALGGSFLAVYGWERRSGKGQPDALRAATGTWLGRLLSTFLKIFWIGFLTALLLTRS